MYTSLSLVYLAVALTFSSCTAHRKGWWNSPRRPAINLRRLHCDKVEQFDLCRCCPDPCESVECQNGGTCVRGICECNSGYSGPDCAVDSCNNRCLNDATCKSGICDCPPMFSGEDCGTKLEPVDLCENVTCFNNGQCSSGICKCTPGYAGEDCIVNLCAITNCPTETTPCVPILAPGGYTCSCVTRILSSGVCDAKSIIAPEQVYRNNLDVKTTIPGIPGKNLTISFIGDFSIEEPYEDLYFDYLEIEGTRYCGFTAPEDITLPPGIGTELRFVTDFSARFEGYTLTYQYIDTVSDCNPCKNGGTLNTHQTCNCMEGFKGSNCEISPILTPPSVYAHNRSTTFTLPASLEKELVLTFDDDFNIVTTDSNCNDTLRTNCTDDYVEIEGTRYCGGVAPEPITITSSNGTIVRFVSLDEAGYLRGDVIVPRGCPTGFMLTYVYRDP